LYKGVFKFFYLVLPTKQGGQLLFSMKKRGERFKYPDNNITSGERENGAYV
jgi:hypothetical protein